MGGVLLGVGLVCFIQWIWSIVKASERIPVSEVPEEDADLTDLQQSLKSLQSLPFGEEDTVLVPVSFYKKLPEDMIVFPVPRCSKSPRL